MALMTKTKDVNKPRKQGSKNKRFSAAASASTAGRRRIQRSSVRQTPRQQERWRQVIAVMVGCCMACIVFVQVHTSTSATLIGAGDLMTMETMTEMIMPAKRSQSSNRNNEEANNKQKKISIAYAVSLLMCGHPSNPFKSISGFLDAVAVLKHSIHLMSEKSKYDYKLYVIVHPKATSCVHHLEDLGYHAIVVDPIDVAEIRGDFLRKTIEASGFGLGSAELIRLHAYNITQHPIVVHVDMDFFFTQPMDELFDAMLLEPGSEESRHARSLIQREAEPFIKTDKDLPMPDRIDAFFSRDYPQTWPGKVPCFQAGMLVLRPSEKVLLEFLEIVKEGHYEPGMHNTESGWGGKGYGWLLGCETVQGVVPYYYDILHPRTAVELDGCIYNHMGVNVLWENGGFHYSRPKLGAYRKFRGQCRNGRGMNCTDCRKTPISEIKSVHFTICGKPWKCSTTNHMGTLTEVNNTLCNELQSAWTDVRLDLEGTMMASKNSIGGSAVVGNVRNNGTFATAIYKGICRGEGSENYIPINMPAEG